MLKGHKHILIPKYYKGSFFEKTAKATVAVFLTLITTLLFGTVNETHAESLTLSISSSDVVLNLAPTSANGTFAESSPISATASTDSSSGYTLSILSSTGSTDLTNTTDHTSKITSISTNLTNSDFSNPSNTQYNNKWGYKPSQWVTVNGDTHTTTTNTGNNAVFRPLPDDTGEIIAITNCANGTSSCTSATDTYTLSMGARVGGSLPTGSYESDIFVITAVTNFNIVECDDTKLCVQFDANGLTFPATSTQDQRFVNNVNYDSATSTTPTTKYAHTPNIDDDGTASGAYPTGSVGFREIVSIPGASNISVTLSYSIEENWDYLYVFTGEYNGEITGAQNTPMSAGQDYTFTGGSSTTSGSNSTTFTITGDTVTFAFWSDPNTAYYGYYATITGYGKDRVLTSGEYAIPTGTNAIFHGWSSTQTTAGGGLSSQVEYADGIAAQSHVQGDNGDTETVYAVWQQEQEITFAKDSNVASIDVLNASGDTVGTITSSGQSLILYQGDTYTLKPTYITGYTTNAINKTTGAGEISGDARQRQFTVGAGSATINVTSRQMLPMQNYSCSNIANIGDTDMVYDTRDNQAYLIGKLADGKCWLLDNLALDLTNSTVLSGMTQDNTNASNTTLGYLKGITTGTTSDQYATAAVSNWTSGYSFYAPLVNMTNKDVIPTDATSTAGGYKVGGYYNYCAATAGSYCYDIYYASSDNATEDICPKGWRLPTGNTSGEYSALANKIYGSTGSTSDATAYANYRSALRLPLSGYFYNGSTTNQGSSGFWWSSTPIYGHMCHLNVTTSNISPADINYHFYGSSVRCVLGS